MFILRANGAALLTRYQ